MTVVMRMGSAMAEGGRGARKEETRQRIMDAAGVLFRRHGIDGVGVDAIMREAGLTHGGFYVHFPSKEALAAEVCAASLSRGARRWADLAGEEGTEALAAIVASYLGADRVAEREAGCILPTLGADLARRPAAHPALAVSIRAMAETIARCRPDADLGRALADLSCMVGAVVLARLAGDENLAGEILTAGRAQVLGGTAAAEG